MHSQTTDQPTTPSISRRGFLSRCSLAALSLAAPTVASAKTPGKKKIDIPVFDEEQVSSNVLRYTKDGFEPPLAVVLGVLIARETPSAAIQTNAGDATKSFFSVTRMRRILEYAARDNADQRVLAALQKELNRKGWWGNQTPWWLVYSAWFKARIIDSFDVSFPFSRTKVIIDCQPKIEDLLRHPLKELE